VDDADVEDLVLEAVLLLTEAADVADVARVEALEDEDGASCLAALHQEVCCCSAANLSGSPGQLL
jgi:hypothetical protein